MAVLSRIVGPVIGLIFGLVFYWLGVGPAFAILGFIAVGWIIGMIVTGEIDLIGFLYTRTRRTKRETNNLDTLMKR
jgi:hypothetical protein